MATKGSYDPVAAEYVARIADELEDKPFDRDLLERLVERVRGLASDGKSGLICDLGCGPGHVGRYLHQLGASVIGIDLSAAMVEEARRVNPAIPFRRGDMRALDAPDGSWGGIAAFYSIIHLPRDEVVAVLGELARVLCPGGWLLLAFHIGDQVVHLDEWWGRAVDLDFTFFQRAEMEGYLRAAGFVVQESLERDPYPDVEHQSRRAYIFARTRDVEALLITHHSREVFPMALTKETLGSLLGSIPEPAPLEPETLEAVDLGDIVREKVRYQVEEGDRVPAYFFVPTVRGQPRPAVLCLHQHAGQFHLGKSEPAGLAGNPEQFYALELARRGYVTLTFDFICFEERRHPVLEGANYERFEFTRRLCQGSTLQAKMLFDASRALDYLAARPEVDPTRIGCIGHSLGGQQTLFTTALDDRITAAVSSCGFASYATIFRDAINHNFSAYVPGILRHGEVGDVLGLVAPRPFLVAVGNADRIFPYDGIVDSVQRAGAAYQSRGAEDRLRLVAVDGGHGFAPPLKEAAYAWLDRWLHD